MKLNIIQAFKPRASRRFLLFTAAFVWSFAGVMLLLRGISLAGSIQSSYWLKITASLTAGGVFYLVLFSRISSGHVRRIISLQQDKPCIFSFFSIKSYLLMILMIASGIIIRKSGILVPEYFSLVCIIMGTPLLLSAYRFCYYGLNYR